MIYKYAVMANVAAECDIVNCIETLKLFATEEKAKEYAEELNAMELRAPYEAHIQEFIPLEDDVNPASTEDGGDETEEITEPAKKQKTEKEFVIAMLCLYHPDCYDSESNMEPQLPTLRVFWTQDEARKYGETEFEKQDMDGLCVVPAMMVDCGDQADVFVDEKTYVVFREKDNLDSESESDSESDSESGSDIDEDDEKASDA